MKVKVSIFDPATLLMSYKENNITLYAGNVICCDEEGDLYSNSIMV